MEVLKNNKEKEIHLTTPCGEYQNITSDCIKIEYDIEIKHDIVNDAILKVVKVERYNAIKPDIYCEENVDVTKKDFNEFIKMEVMTDEYTVDEDTTNMHNDIVVKSVKTENINIHIIDHNPVKEEPSSNNDTSIDAIKLDDSIPLTEVRQEKAKDLCTIKSELRDEEKRCDICPYKNINVNQFLSHLRAHAATVSYSCKLCHYITVNKHNMDGHNRTHSGEKPYLCKVCKRTFSRQSDLYQHKGIHGGRKPFTCDICKESFRQKRSLRIHLKSHYGDGFTCYVCKKTFNRKDNLQMHLRIHTGEKPYACDRCEERFSRKDYLRTHLLTHTSERPFKCGVCCKGFVSNCSLQRHSRTHPRLDR